MSVHIHWEERAVARLAAHVAVRVTGVERLDERPPLRAAALPRAVFGQASVHGGAVTASRAPDGSVDLAIRVISRLRPSPVEVARAVGLAVEAEVGRTAGVHVRTEVAVTDIASDLYSVQ